MLNVEDEVRGLRDEIKEIKSELRTVADTTIRLEEQFRAANAAADLRNAREEKYYQEFIQHQKNYQRLRENVFENTKFRESAKWNIRVIWSAFIAAGVGVVMKMFMLK